MTMQASLSEMNDRSREVFRLLVENFLENGEPVGSRTLARHLSERVSAATVRNVMQDLEELGLLDSPHISAGRMPTEFGLRLFVDGLMEVSDLSTPDRSAIEKSLGPADTGMSDTLDRASTLLSSLTNTASLVLSPKTEAPIKHFEFLALSPEQAMVVLVLADGTVENRLFKPPIGMTPSTMRESANFLNAVLEGRNISDIRDVVEAQINIHQREIDSLSKDLIEKGVAEWSASAGPRRLIVSGQSHLLQDGTTNEDLERIRQLLDDLERKEGVAQLLDLTETGDGVRVFIGSENKLFSLSGSSLVVSPYMNAERQIIGAIGVIGPKRLNYGRVVPIVDFTAQLVGRMLSDR